MLISFSEIQVLLRNQKIQPFNSSVWSVEIWHIPDNFKNWRKGWGEK